MQFWALFGMVWACVLRLGHLQDRLLYPTEVEPTEEGNHGVTETIDGVPERLLISMKDIKNASDFFRRFIVEPQHFPLEGEGGSSYHARRTVPSSAFGNGLTEIEPFAACRPELKVVKLHRGSASGVMYWPPCVRLRRCGGCCMSKLLECRPVAVSPINITVLQVRLSPQRPDAFESDGERMLSLEQHERCACGCRQLPEECIPGVQEYRQSECRCVCMNRQEALQCVGPERLWDSTECVCKCKHPSDCSTGFFYNFLSCRCEIYRDSVLAALQYRTTYDDMRSRIQGRSLNNTTAGP